VFQEIVLDMYLLSRVWFSAISIEESPMDQALKDATKRLMQQIEDLPEPQRTAIVEQVKEIRRLSGIRMIELEQEIKGLVPVW
jgi:hypothetical protein